MVAPSPKGYRLHVNGLPLRLRAYLDRNLPEQQRTADRVDLEQVGTMRLKPGGRETRFTAEQWITTTTLGFCWHARVKMAPLVTAVVEDAYEDGHGRLDVHIWGKLRVAHAEGPELDRGETQRYLAELPWAPQAFLHNDALRFEDREEAVRVWAHEPETYVDLFFDDRGDIVRTFTTTRTRGEEGTAPWEGQYFAYGEQDGVRMPTQGAVSWRLPDGPFEYWRGEIVTARFT